MDEEQRIYMEQGVEEYVRYQLQHENEPFSPGPAFPFVKVSGSPLLEGGVRKKHLHGCLSKEKGPSGRTLPHRSTAWLGTKPLWEEATPYSGLMQPHTR